MKEYLKQELTELRDLLDYLNTHKHGSLLSYEMIIERINELKEQLKREFNRESYQKWYDDIK